MKINNNTFKKIEKISESEEISLEEAIEKVLMWYMKQHPI